MSDGRLRAAVAALAVAGIGISGYLLAVRATGSAITCSTGGCETVQSSRYSEILGVPVAALGLAAYAALLASALGRGELARATGVAVALAGAGFSLYLLVVQVAVIGAVCDWCLASDAVVTLAAIPALLRLHPLAFARGEIAA